MTNDMRTRVAALVRHLGLVLGVSGTLVPAYLFAPTNDTCCTLRSWPELAEFWGFHTLCIGLMWSAVVLGYRKSQTLAGAPWLWSLLIAIGAATLGAAMVMKVFPLFVDDALNVTFGWAFDVPLNVDANIVLWWWSFAWCGVISVLFTLTLALWERSRRLDNAMHDAELERTAQERRIAESQASLLQAQVEPHFVFNALANVRRLFRVDAGAAQALLADLLLYLQRALPLLSETQATLADELELVQAFLGIYAVRMGGRLQYSLDVPPTLLPRAMPPMLVLTLVENALKHGLWPLEVGGAIHISARSDVGQIVLTVTDTGRGMGAAMGSGAGLANLRARLRSLYGDRASLSLAVNSPQGVRACIRLPEHDPECAHGQAPAQDTGAPGARGFKA